MRSMAPSASPLPAPPTPSVARGRLGGLLGLVSVGAAMAWLWGFTVDDALITCRVAWHLARGVGYRFNASGPVVDAVTPLGFAYVLSPFAAAGPLAALSAAKWLGALLVAAAGLLFGASDLLAHLRRLWRGAPVLLGRDGAVGRLGGLGHGDGAGDVLGRRGVGDG